MKWLPVAFFLSGMLLAQDLFDLERVPGKPLRMRFADGRLAEFKISPQKITYFEFATEVFQNFCTPFSRIACTANFGFRAVLTVIMWIEHPTRPGQIVHFAGSDFDFDLVGLAQFTGLDRKLKPTFASQIRPDELRCEDYRWLPGGSEVHPPDRLFASRWDMELMMANPETGLSENRTVAILAGAELTHSEKNTLVFSDFERKIQNHFGIPADIFALTLVPPNASVCQISLKPNFSDIVDRISAYFTSLELKPETYLAGQDELTEKGLPEIVERMQRLAREEGARFQ